MDDALIEAGAQAICTEMGIGAWEDLPDETTSDNWTMPYPRNLLREWSAACLAALRQHQSAEGAMRKSLTEVRDIANRAAGEMVGLTYRHAKGALYSVGDVAIRESDLEPCVLYYAQHDATSPSWIRPLTEFRERFTLAAPSAPDSGDA